jgi:hypothetical protein
VRPVDLGLVEGKAMAFAPTQALAPAGPPIGGLAPAQSNGTAAPAPEAPPSQPPTSSARAD